MPDRGGLFCYNRDSKSKIVQNKEPQLYEHSKSKISFLKKSIIYYVRKSEV